MPRLVPPVVSPGTLVARALPTLTTGEGIGARPWNEADAPDVFDAFLDPDIQRWNMRRMDNEEEARQWIRGWHTRWTSETDASWAITPPQARTAAGYVALRLIVLEFGYAEVTYWVRAHFRSRGLATAAVKLVTDWALDEIGLHRLEIKHSVNNGPSCAVARNAGFAVEGTARSALLHADGWHDMHVHARVSAVPRTGLR